MLETLEAVHPLLPALAGALALLLVAALADWVVSRILAAVVHRIAARSRANWDDALVAAGVFGRAAKLVPALIIQQGIRLVPDWSATAQTIVTNITNAWLALIVTLTLTAVLSAVNAIYEQRPGAGDRPIKGFIQLAQLGIAIVGIVMIIAALIDRSPVILLSGVGAITAVLLIIFKDTLLSLAASVQLASQQLIRVGDWLEVPQFGADGDVIDVALYTVTVQNWDKTIVTIPTYKLVADSFKNWRGMSESGGRRIKRPIYIDMNSIRFLTEAEVERFARFRLLRDYIPAKQQELADYNAAIGQTADEVNLRRLTNIGTLRAYIVNYLRHHPKVHQDMTLIVRQLAPGTTGLPIEIYCFSNDTNWSHYEDIQSDIFDHICAIVPEFGLRLYQQPAGSDWQALGHSTAPR
ncbi:MAG: mechanosensitive ion channel domain-containing protein [Gammaproteobacteria bacterium]|jgi:miniconductance mechanosensitive channel|nr:mechanosensitive ion channel domain-containing protein [Gammaproteobacteria bacterium]